MTPMTDRERFVATMHYQQRDRCPICDFGFWPETVELWHSQGLPKSVGGGHDTTTTDQFFGMDSYWGSGPGGHVGLYPGFEYKVLEDHADHRIVQDGSGVVVQEYKNAVAMPLHLRHTLVDRESWNKHFKWRLDPTTPDRIPKDLDAARKLWQDPNRPTSCNAWCGSLFGWLRDWMGLEGVSYIVYDDPALFEEMVTTLADVTVGVLERLFAAGAKFEAGSMWEDMCYRAGPLLGVPEFRKYLVPNYKRITSVLRKNGCDVLWLDCDGCIDHLLPMWLDAGVNCMFPVEIGTWGADPVKYRKQYGKELLMMGGFDKHILAKGKREIETEVHRLAPLVEEGGFIPFADHRVPPDVPLENYMHYLETARKVWGKGVNLKPLGKVQR